MRNGAGGGWQGVEVPEGDSLGPDQVGYRVVRGQTGAARTRWRSGTGGKTVVLGHWEWGGGTGVGYQTRDGVPDKGWGSKLGMEFQSGMGLQTRDGVQDMGMGFKTRDGIPDMGMGFPDMGWGSRHWVGYQTQVPFQT